MPPVQWVTWDLSSEIKRSGRESIYLPLAQNEWSCSLRSLPLRFFWRAQGQLKFCIFMPMAPRLFFLILFYEIRKRYYIRG